MRVTPTVLPAVLLVEPDIHRDARGAFLESWNEARYRGHGIGDRFVQDNLSVSGPSVLRGLHMQTPATQAKLVSVLDGAVFDVAVDARAGSPTFGRWAGVRLDAQSGAQLYIPEGFLHGFCVLGDRAVVAYKLSAPYDPAGELAVRWDDPALAIDWPVASPVLSDRDRAGVALADIPCERLPPFRGPA